MPRKKRSEKQALAAVPVREKRPAPSAPRMGRAAGEYRSAFCPVCLAPGTLVYKHPSFQRIESFQPSESIMGLKSMSSVKELLCRPYRGDVIHLKARYLAPVNLTPEHPVLVAEMHEFRDYPQYGRRYESKINWKKAGDLRVGGEEVHHFDCLLVPKWKLESNPELDVAKFYGGHGKTKEFVLHPVFTNAFAEFCGWYVAEGSVTVKSVQFALGSHETGARERIRELSANLGYTSYWKEQKGEKGGQVTVNSRVLPRFLCHYFGRGARNKRVPWFIMQARDGLVDSFLRGYQTGDGSVFQDKKGAQNLSISSVSEQLIRQLQLLYLRRGIVLGYSEAQPSDIIQGRTVNSARQYSLRGKLVRNPKWHFFFEDVNFYYFPIVAKSVYFYEGSVFNLETEEGVYFLPFAVHNCGTSHGTKRLEYPQKGYYSPPATQNYWQWIMDRDRERGLDKDEPFGVIQEVGMGRGRSFGVIGHFGPEDDPDGFYPLVKERLLQAVRRWLQNGWLSREEIEGVLAMAESGR